MKKALLRSLVVLMVCTLIGVGLTWLAQNQPGLLGLGAGREGFGRGGFDRRGSTEGFDPLMAEGDLSQGRTRPGFGEGNFPAGEFREGGHAGDGIALARGLAGVLRNLLAITLITLGVVVIEKITARVFRKKMTPAVQRS